MRALQHATRQEVSDFGLDEIGQRGAVSVWRLAVFEERVEVLVDHEGQGSGTIVAPHRPHR